MDDAISRAAVHIVINSQIFDTEYPSELDELERQIDALPALDAVPVVRCVDCKHRYTFVCPMYHTETYIGDLDGFDDDYEVDRTDDDGFCHLGERLDGEEDEAD